MSDTTATPESASDVPVLQSASLRPKARSVLDLLYQNRGKVVKKEDILDAVWGDVVVTGDSLVQCISEIRNKLAVHPSIELKTFARRGYMLSIPDDFSTLSTDGASLPSIAIMPFINLAGKKGSAFVFGLTEDIINELSRHKDIFVVAQHSSNRYVNEIESSNKVSVELGVRYILRGNVQIDNGVARVNVQFIDAGSSALVWSERYENSVDSFFIAQDVISAAVVNRIGGSDGVMISTERKRLKRSYTSDISSYDHYVMGSNVDQYFTKEGSQKACAHLEQAVAIDPLFTRAWCRLAALYLLQIVFTYTNDLEMAAERYVQAALTAVDIDPDDSFAQALAGGGWFMAGEPEKGKECFSRALEMGPNHADVLAFIAYVRPSKLPTADEDLANIRRAMRLNPFYPLWYTFSLGYSAFYSGDYETCITELKKVHDQYFDKQLYLTLSYASIGDIENCAKHREQLLEMQPDLSISYLIEADSICDSSARTLFKAASKAACLPE